MNNKDLLTSFERLYGPFLHMAPRDKSIWLRFLINGGFQFAPFLYDVRVGNGNPLPTNATARLTALNYALTTKRIDVIFHHNDETVIVEVKHWAGLGAVGQLIGYQELYKQTFPDQGTPRMLLVTDKLQPDMEGLLNSYDIRFAEVGLDPRGQ